MRDAYDAIAPDGSEIRLLSATGRASMVHARLPAGRTARAVAHRTVDEIWFCIGGSGELWRRSADGETLTPLHAGVSVTLPVGTAFQWRNTGTDNLDVVIATIPPWPGDLEAEPRDGPWRA